MKTPSSIRAHMRISMYLASATLAVWLLRAAGDSVWLEHALLCFGLALVAWLAFAQSPRLHRLLNWLAQ